MGGCLTVGFLLPPASVVVFGEEADFSVGTAYLQKVEIISSQNG